jgi:prepilin-type N-terminal cleavage/methylation domain-containing protein
MRLTSPSGGRAACAAFTLIELLTVIAIIGILAAITFGVSRGVNERAAINQARAELSVLASALEAYKRQYGDYPHTGNATNAQGDTASATDGPGILFNALAGKRGPKTDPAVPINGKVFVQFDKLSLQDVAKLPAVTGTVSVENAFLDPWGRRYLYFYKTNNSWESTSYVLYSVGPDNRHASPSNTGVIDFANVDNLDNIYSNR